MGEPIRLWASDGTYIDVYSPSTAMHLIEQGLKPFEPAPLTIEVPTPDDTQEVPVVRKPRKRETGTGVL